MFIERKKIINTMHEQIQTAEKLMQNPPKAIDAKTAKVAADTFKQLNSTAKQLSKVKTDLQAYRSRFTFNFVARVVLYFADLFQTSHAKREIRKINDFLKDFKVPVNNPPKQPENKLADKQKTKEEDFKAKDRPLNDLPPTPNEGNAEPVVEPSKKEEEVAKANDQAKMRLIDHHFVLHYTPDVTNRGDFYALDVFINDLFEAMSKPGKLIPSLLALINSWTRGLKFKASAWEELEALKKNNLLQKDLRDQIEALLAKKPEMQDRILNFQKKIAQKLNDLEAGTASSSEMAQAVLMKSELTKLNQWLEENFFENNVPGQSAQVKTNVTLKPLNFDTNFLSSLRSQLQFIQENGMSAEVLKGINYSAAQIPQFIAYVHQNREAIVKQLNETWQPEESLNALCEGLDVCAKMPEFAIHKKNFEDLKKTVQTLL